MEASTPVPGDHMTIACVRVANFRSIHAAEVRLGALTLLLGANNSGKTSFLEALNMAVGASRAALGRDDIFMARGEASLPREREAVVDVLIRPAHLEGAVADVFASGGYWTEHWGTNIRQDTDDRDFVAIRARLRFSEAHGEYRIERRFLQRWITAGDWTITEERNAVTASDIEPMALHLMSAQRDLGEDLRSRQSFWYRLTEDLGFAADDIAAFEDMLEGLNQRIASGSPVLRHLGDRLSVIGRVLAGEGTQVSVSPIPGRFRDFSRVLDVLMASEGGQDLSVVRHGMGTRSLASLIVFRAYTEWRGSLVREKGGGLHALLGLEEPEAHLHPQAQRSLFRQVKEVPGQRIVSTHSPYFVAQAALDEIRLFRREGGTSRCSELDLGELLPDQRAKLHRSIIASRGDILFARSIVLFEGETEEQAIPLLAEAHLGTSIHELGLSVVPVHGDGGYLPFLRLAQGLGIPWFILADGEEGPVGRLNRQLREASCGDLATLPNVFVLPDGTNFETYLLAQGYGDCVESGIREWGGERYTDEFIERRHGTTAKRGMRDFRSAGGRERALLEILRENKVATASCVATAITAAMRNGRPMPPVMGALLDAVAARLPADHRLQPGSSNV